MSESSQAHAARARENLDLAVASLRDSAAFRRHLAVMAQFHSYSFHNQLLIGRQMPEASYVRGFKAWLDAGRAVRKGERGLRIFAPRPWQRETAVDETGTLQVEQGVSFVAVPVFDVSQTDPIPGHPHPWQPPVRHPATGDEAVARSVWQAMTAHAEALGVTISTSADHEPGRSVFGYYRPGARLIWIRPDRETADMAATLAHELAHVVTVEPCANLPRDVHEVIAESIAYAVCSRFGLDLSLRSVAYVAAWLDDPDAFKAGMSAIHDGAASLIDAIEAGMIAADELALAA